MSTWCCLLTCILTSCTLAGAPLREGLYADDGQNGDFRGTATFAAPEETPNSVPPSLAVEAPVARVARQVIYSAGLRLVVVSTAESMRSIHDFAREVGGYLQESDSRSITIRVPADKFEATLSRIETLGEVVDRSVKASDVTEQMLDLNIRLENARKTRERLLEHLSMSTKIEDTLKIEAELSRVSGEIEQMEGRLRFLQSQVAMSTIRVELNSLAPERRGAPAGLGLPFEWVAQLGDGLIAGNVESTPRKPRFFSSGPRFDPPPGFIRYYSNDTLVEAMNADGVRIKLQKQANYDQGELVFWSKLARKSLVQGRALSVNDERDLGDDRALIAGTRDVAGSIAGYMVVIARTKNSVYTFEAWAPKAEFEAQLAKLITSARSLAR